MVYATPVQTKDFTFDINVNLSKNLSTVEELYEGKDYVFFDGDDNFPVWVGAVAGGKLGDIYARHLLKRNDKGELILKDGLPQDNNEADLNYILSHPIGNIQPDLLMSVTPTFSYKGFTLSAMFDMKFGGDIVSISEGMATNAGTAERTENRGSEDNGWKILLPGVKKTGLLTTFGAMLSLTIRKSVLIKRTEMLKNLYMTLRILNLKNFLSDIIFRENC